MKIYRTQKLAFLVFCAIIAISFTLNMQGHGAIYPGGREALDKYFQDSLRYPESQLQLGNEGIVQVSFDISAAGVAENPVTSSLFGGAIDFEKEVARLVLAMPKWEPAVNKRGKPTAGSGYAVVRFQLPDSLASKFPLAPDRSLYPNFDSIEIMPQFQGGERAFQSYLQWSIRYPHMEKEEGKDGTVYVYFEVSKIGKIENVSCKKGVPGAPGLTKEAIRVISSMPRWIPGYKDGKPVKVSMTVPVKFVLN